MQIKKDIDTLSMSMNISRSFFGLYPGKKIQTITDEKPKNLSTSKRKPIKLEKDLGEEFYNSFLQNFLKVKKHWSNKSWKKEMLIGYQNYHL